MALALSCDGTLAEKLRGICAAWQAQRRSRMQRDLDGENGGEQEM
jgi:hypothetical protein